MRKMLFTFAVLLLLGGVVAWQLQQGSGYILIAVGTWTIEMSLWVDILLLALLWLVGLLLKAVIVRLFGPSRGVVPVWRRTRQGRLRRRRERGLQQLLEGRWSEAEKILTKTGRKNDEPLLDWLAASSAALGRGDYDQARRLLANAAALEPDGVGVRLQESRLLMAEGRSAEALPILEALHGREPLHHEVLRLLVISHRSLGNWQALEKLLPELKRNAIFSEARYLDLQLQVYGALLEQAARAGSDKDLVSHRDRVLMVWERIPTRLRRDTGLLTTFIRQLHIIGEGRLAETQLRGALKRQWVDELVELFGVVEHRDLADSLALAERWLPAQEHSVALLLTLGRLCVRLELWGKARDYFEAAARLGGNSAVYVELAALSARSGETARSAEYYRRGLEARGGEVPHHPPA